MNVAARESKMSVEDRGSSAESPGKTLATASPLLVLISAPSGGGKTTICKQLLAARPKLLQPSPAPPPPAAEASAAAGNIISLTENPFSNACKRENFLD